MERVNEHLLQELGREWEASLCGPVGCAGFAPGAAEVAEVPLKPLPAFVLRSAWRAWRLARRRRPRLVLAGSGLAAPMAWIAARCCGASMAVYLHGLDVIAPSRLYQYAWLPFIRAADLLLVNSENTGKLAVSRGVRAQRIAVLHPGTSLPSPDGEARSAFRTRHGLGDAPVLLSVGRFTQRKGLREFVARCLPAIVEQMPNALLLVIGAEASDALHGGGGGEAARILAAAEQAGVSSHLRFLGTCNEAELAQAYRAADCHVFPVLDLPGDVEGFGMVALESAAHGLATVAFDVGGVADAVREGVSGRLIRPGNYPAMAAAIVTCLARTEAQRQQDAERSHEFAAGFEWSRFGARLRELVSGLLRDRGSVRGAA